MRNKKATVLIGVGVYFLTLALLVPLVLQPVLLKAPAKIDLETHSRSTALKMDTSTGRLRQVDVDLTRRLTTHTINGKVAGSDRVGVYDELLDLKQVNPDGTLPPSLVGGTYQGLSAQTSVIAFDRSSGKGVHRYGDTWSTVAQTTKFPFGVQKRTYRYYDQPSHAAWPVSYVRTLTVKGLQVYEFHGTIPQISLGQYGVLAGTDTLYSNNGRTVWVEPVTGSIVSSTTSPQTRIRMPNGTITPALLVKELVPTDATIAERVSYSKGVKSSAEALYAAPWVLGGVAVVLLVLGTVLAVRTRRSQVIVLPGTGTDGRHGAVPSPRTESAVGDLVKH